MTKKSSLIFEILVSAAIIVFFAYIMFVVFQNTERQLSGAKAIENKMDTLITRANEYFKNNNTYKGICENPSDFLNIYNEVSKPNPSLLYINCAQDNKRCGRYPKNQTPFLRV